MVWLGLGLLSPASACALMPCGWDGVADEVRPAAAVDVSRELTWLRWGQGDVDCEAPAWERLDGAEVATDVACLDNAVRVTPRAPLDPFTAIRVGDELLVRTGDAGAPADALATPDVWLEAVSGHSETGGPRSWQVLHAEVPGADPARTWVEVTVVGGPTLAVVGELPLGSCADDLQPLVWGAPVVARLVARSVDGAVSEAVDVVLDVPAKPEPLRPLRVCGAERPPFGCDVGARPTGLAWVAVALGALRRRRR